MLKAICDVCDEDCTNYHHEIYAKSKNDVHDDLFPINTYLGVICDDCLAELIKLLKGDQNELNKRASYRKS